MQLAVTRLSGCRTGALSRIAGLALLTVAVVCGPAADQFAHPQTSNLTDAFASEAPLLDQPGPGYTDQEAETAEQEGEMGVLMPSESIITEQVDEDLAVSDETTGEDVAQPLPSAFARPSDRKAAPMPTPLPAFRSSVPKQNAQLDILVQRIISAVAVLVVLAGTVFYTGSLRQRIAQQNEFIQKRGEALAAVETRLRDTFTDTRSNLEMQITARDLRIAELEAALETETAARIQAELALGEFSGQPDPASPSESDAVPPYFGRPPAETPATEDCLEGLAYDLTTYELATGSVNSVSFTQKRRSPLARRSNAPARRSSPAHRD